MKILILMEGKYMNYTEKLKQETNKADDFIYKDIYLGKNHLELITIETIASSNDINNFILKRISFLDKLSVFDLTSYLYNYLPASSISIVNDYDTLKEKLLNSDKFHMKLKITFSYKWKERIKFRKSLLDFQIEMSQYIVI